MVQIYPDGNMVVFVYEVNQHTKYFSRDDVFHVHRIGNIVGIYSMSKEAYTLDTPFRIVRHAHYSQFKDGDGVVFTSASSLVEYLVESLNESEVTPVSPGTPFKYTAQNYDQLLTIIIPVPEAFDLAYVFESQGTKWLPGSVGGTYYPNGVYMYTGEAWVSSRNAIAGEFASVLDRLNAEEAKSVLFSNDIITLDNAIDSLVGDINGLAAEFSVLDSMVDSIADQLTNLSEDVGIISDAIDAINTTLGQRLPSADEKAALAGTSGTPSNINRYVTSDDLRLSNARTPTAHTHSITEVTGLQSILDNKAAAIHTHAISDVTGLQTALNGKAATTHTHTITDVTGLQTALNGKAALAHTHAPADIIQDTNNRFVTDAEKTTWNAKQNTIGFTPENAALKNQNNGYAGLDSAGLIPAALLPSYVDDVLEFTNLASFPAVGTSGKMFVALDTGRVYRWSGTIYVRIANPGTTDDVIEGVINLYFTTARVLATALTGFAVPVSAVVVATDTVLGAFGKVQAQLNNILNIVLTGIVFTANTAVTAADSILVAIGKLQSQITAINAALTQTGGAVTRPINSTSFIPSTTKVSSIRYTIRCSAQVSLSGAQTAEFFLETSPDGTTWTERDSCGLAYTATLVVGVTILCQQRGTLEANLLPPNTRVRIRPNLIGGGTGTYLNGFEAITG